MRSGQGNSDRHDSITNYPQTKNKMVIPIKKDRKGKKRQLPFYLSTAAAQIFGVFEFFSDPVLESLPLEFISR